MPNSNNFQLDDRKRSRRYPGANLKFCLKMAADIYRLHGENSMTKEELAEVVAEGGAIGTVNRRIGALAQFGFTIRDEDGIALTPLAINLVMRPDDLELLRVAFLNPDVYVELLSELGQSTIPSQMRLAEILNDKDFGILPSKVDHAAKIFWESAHFANLLTAAPADLLAEPVEPRQASAPPTEVGTTAQPIGHRSFSLSSPKVEVVVPEKLTDPEKVRLREWLTKVVMPAIKFLD